MDPRPDSHDDADPPPVEPALPDDDACCGNGCDPCVYDIYAAERERYFIALRAWQARRQGSSQGLPTRPEQG